MKVDRQVIIVLIGLIPFIKSSTFFGDGFESLTATASHSFVEDNATEVRLEFKTPKTDGFLYQMDGDRSSCQITLESGRIRVRYKLPSTDSVEFWSPNTTELKLHDLKWHKLLLRQSGVQYLLIVDNQRVSFAVGMSFEEAQFGHLQRIFVGGINGVSKKSANYFFGCISNVSLNRLLLTELPSGMSMISVNVQDEGSCSEIFEQPDGTQPISLHHDSFLGFGIFEETVTPLVLNLNVRPDSSSGYLFHATNTANLELNQVAEPEFKLSVDRGNLLLEYIDGRTTIEAKSQLHLTTGVWYFLGLRQNDDEESWTLSLDSSSENVVFPAPLLKLKELFIGSSALIGEIDQDLSMNRSLEDSFSGCVENIYYKFQRLTFRNATTARNIHSTCNLKSPCSYNHCPFGSECQDSLDSTFICVCNSELCSLGQGITSAVSLNKIFAANDEARNLREMPFDADKNLMYVNGPLMAGEGQSARVVFNHLVLYQQHRRYGLMYHNVILRLLGQPDHGKLTIGISKDSLDHRLVRGIFTYEDLLLGKVNYTHDGSETREDRLEFEVEFQNLNQLAPASMREKRMIELPVKILPVNDLPTLTFPTGKVIRLAENSKITVTQRQIQISDPDNAPRDVKIKIHFATPDIGYFEDSQKPTIRLMEFTQDDLVTGKIRFVHFGSLEGIVTVSVADLEGESERYDLRILAFPIQLRMITRTRLSVLHNTCGLITSGNLSFETNAAAGQNVEVKYQIVDIPKFGSVEVQNRQTGRWQLNAVFNQTEVNQERVRYCHTAGGQPTTDFFKFKVSALSLKSDMSYDLEVIFVPVNVKVFNPNPFILNNSQSATLNRDHLFAWTFPKNVPTNEIAYRLSYPPKFGFLQKIIDPSKNRNRRLGLNANFTQADLDSDLIFYSLHMHPQYTVLNDLFRFKVITPIVQSDEMMFEITYLPGDEAIKLINRTLIAREGSLQKISNSTIFLETSDDKEFVFTLKTPPINGEFHVLGRSSDGSTRAIFKNENFTTADLQNGRVFYRHDSSETLTDRAFFEATPLYRHRAPFRIKFWFRIRITLENDNAPERILAFGDDEAPIFHVQNRGEKTVTKYDLEFRDDDSDFDSENLMYFSPENFKDGGFFWERQPDVSAKNFTQKDINMNRLVFRHTGSSSSFSLPFYVTDGSKSTKSHFQVNASEPFAKLRTNTGILTESGAVTVITQRNLSVLTNLRAKDSDIIFRVLKKPKFGSICVLKPDLDECDRTDLFTQEDLQERRVLYSHSGGETPTSDDEMVMIAEVENLEVSVRAHIKILSKDSTEKLEMENVEELVVTERSLTEISSEFLKATHPRYMPGSIRYFVVDPPKYGTLFRARQIEGALISGENTYFESFSQFHINSGELFYQHYESPATSDRFTFNVSAGDSTLGNQIFFIKILSHKVELTVRNFSAPAGGHIVLDRRVLSPESSFFNGPNPEFVYRITKSPKNGWLRSRAVNPPKDRVTSFTSEELDSEKICYVHDGQPTWKDQFTVSVSLKDDETTRSENRTLHITILHENLKYPEIEANVPLKMYNNKWTTISDKHLKFVDLDNPPEQIQYLVSPQNGYLAFNFDPTRPISEFSQKDIDEKSIVFIRASNGTTAGFTFIVSDGKHETERYWFAVEISDLSATLEANNRLVLPPGAEYYIGLDLLRASVANAQPTQIVYTITRAPTYGKILLNGTERTSFTQQNVNQRLVSYIQSEKIRGWLVKDNFWFVISLNGSNRFVPELEEEQRFKILISYATIPKKRLREFMTLTNVALPPGGSLAINSSHVNISRLTVTAGETLVIRLVRGPKSGWLTFKGRNVTGDTLEFRQQDLDDNLLVFHHSNDKNSDTELTGDQILMEVFPKSDNYAKKRRNLTLKFKLPIVVGSENGKRMQIRAFKETLKMVRETTYAFGPDDFYVEERNISPMDIKYEIIQGTNTGFFFREGSVEPSLSEFTQAQINKGKIIYVQRGSRKEGSFTLQISSDNFQTMTRVVRVVVSPLTLSLMNASIITYKQGESYVILSRDHLGADSNGERANILYNITQAPQNGSFLTVGKHEKTASFTQADVDRGQILYAQMNMGAWRDAFTFEVTNSANKIGPEKLGIRVLPAVIQSPVSVYPGESVLITLEALDATELEDKAPVFAIVRPPTYGDLYKIIPVAADSSAAPEAQRSKRNANRPKYGGGEQLEKIDFFTLEDLKMSSVEYINTLEKAHNPLEDHFIYELRADDVQPARGKFTIQIVSTDSTGLYGLGTSTARIKPATTAQADSWLPITIPNVTENFMIAIYVVAGILFAALLFVVFRRVRIAKERARRREKEAALQAHHLASNPADLLESTVYASVGSRTSGTFRLKNGLAVPSQRSNLDPVMFRSLTMERPNKRAQATPPPKYATLNRDRTPADGAAARMVTFDPGRTEVISSLPMCKVTPLTPRSAQSTGMVSTTITNSGSFDDYNRYAYQYSSSDNDLKAERLSLDRATGYKSRKKGLGSSSINQPPPTKATKLNENQYWV